MLKLTKLARLSIQIRKFIKVKGFALLKILDERQKYIKERRKDDKIKNKELE